MLRHLAVLAALAFFAGCPGRIDNFGTGDDVGDVGADMPGVGDGDVAPARSAIGERCDGPSSCVEEALCIGAKDGEFRCMARCATPYALCADGSVCLPVTAQEGSICYRGGATPSEQACENNLDCAPGLLCFGADAQFFCRAACEESAATCGDGEYCSRVDSGAGLCRAEVGAPCPGAPCGADLLCSLDDADIAPLFPRGLCTRTCAEPDGCPANAACARFADASVSVCVATCDHDSDCRFNAGYRCLDDAACAASSDVGACEAFFAGRRLCLAAAP